MGGFVSFYILLICFFRPPLRGSGCARILHVKACYSVYFDCLLSGKPSFFFNFRISVVSFSHLTLCACVITFLSRSRLEHGRDSMLAVINVFIYLTDGRISASFHLFSRVLAFLFNFLDPLLPNSICKREIFVSCCVVSYCGPCLLLPIMARAWLASVWGGG